MSQEEDFYTGVHMTPVKEVQYSWPLAQGCPENSLTIYLNGTTQSQHTIPFQINVPGVDDLQKSPSAARDSSCDLVYSDLPLIFELHQNSPDIIRGENIQNEVIYHRDMVVTSSSSYNGNLASETFGTLFREDIDSSHLIANKDPVAEQASKRDKQKEANKDIQSGSGYEEPLANTGHSHDDVKLKGEGIKIENRVVLEKVINVELNSEQAAKGSMQKEASLEMKSNCWKYEQMELILPLSRTYLPDEGKESNTIQNEERDIRNMANAGNLCVQNGTRVTSQFLINDQNEASPEIKSQDINEDTENIIEGHSDAHFGLYRLSQRNQEQQKELPGYGDRSVLETSDACPTNRSRCDQIIVMSAEEMEHHIWELIQTGAFGIVYKAMIPNEKNRMSAITKYKVTEHVFQMMLDKEIFHGRILHPFINPILARAERPPNKLEQRTVYLMYPYMQNRDVRCNIDSVNDGKILCPNESNSNIWIRCVHQIVQAVDFLHSSVELVKRPIFHRDLTSRNILLDENFNVRICDFGIAVEAKYNAARATSTTALGTRGYHPPNMNLCSYNASYDIFSVGVVILEILTGVEASFEEDPHYLYERYYYKGGYEDLIEDLDAKAEENEAAIWNNIRYRNKLAELALQAVELDEQKRRTISLCQKLEEIRLSRDCCYYRKPENQDRCVSCCMNPIAKLSTKGLKCIGVERTNPCRYFCIHCLMNHYINPLVCPQHGRTRPPFGDYVYGVFVAGNSVDETQQYTVRQDPNETANIKQMFTRNVLKVVEILKGKHPFVFGHRKVDLKVVMPCNPGTEDEMEPRIKQTFEDINAKIMQAIKMENLDPERDRIPSSLFIFYFSGHCSAEEGLYLGSTKETLKASTPWIQEMLHKKLGVDQIVVILDCCHANSQNFTDTHGLDDVVNFKDGREKARIVQLSSCDVPETFSAKFEGEGHCSFFTDLLCQGLLGLDSVPIENHTVIFCDECEKDRPSKNVIDITLPCGKYHSQCMSDHGVTIYALKNFIQEHFQHLRGVISGPEVMTLVDNDQEKNNIYLAYYNPFKWHIPIHLKGSEVSHIFFLNTHTGSMDKLRQDIIKHLEEENLQCEIQVVLEFCKRRFSQTSPVEKTSSLIAIHPVTRKDAKELRSLEDLWKVRACGRTLEAKIRDSVKELKLNCPVKLNNLNRAMTSSLENGYDCHGLRIRKDYIHVKVSLIKEVIRAIQMQKSAKVFSEEFQELLENLKDILLEVFDRMEGTLLKIHLYEEFSILETTCPGQMEHAHELEGDEERMVSETCDTFSTSKEKVFCLPINPRSGRIIAMTVTEMKKYIEEKIGEGAFGKVYKAKKLVEECEFVIRKIKVTEEVYQRSYEKETECGRILHPFINPVIARAEFPAVSKVGIYLMYPYMKNKDLRYNIDLENCRMHLSQEETNSRIWLRCIYQIALGLDYLHKPVKSQRGPIFHRDLTSRNIFLDENFNARIGDFGIAAEANYSATLAKVFTTEGYHPPNMNQYKYNTSYDIFSVGVVMLEILTGEMAVLNNDPYFLHKKYNCDMGIEYLKEYLDERAEENEAAAWIKEHQRNMLAEVALNAVSLNGMCKEAVDLLQKLDEMCLDARERYREPKVTDRCVSCYINPTAKLALKGAYCIANETKKACQPFCLQCLMNHHVNPLVCPKHGKTRPPFGDRVFGVFVAGNYVEDMQPSLYEKDLSYSNNDVAQMFINDVEKVVKVLTAKYPFVLGASAEHLKIVKAYNPGTKEDMKTRIKEAFKDVKALIKFNQNPKNDRLTDSLFIFYFTGHCSKDKGLYLGNAEETIKASTTGSEKKTPKTLTKWIFEMLHNKLRVDQVLVILDCCHADSQNFAIRQGLKTGSEDPVNIVQLSSCVSNEKSNSRFMIQGLGSYFTHFFCQSLQVLGSTGWEDDAIVCCEECEKRRHSKNQIEMALPCVKYYTQCRKNQCLKVGSIRAFIQGHFDLLWGETSRYERIQQEKDIVLSYYNPCKNFVTILLKGSDDIYCMSTHQESMDDLKQGIIIYIVEKKVLCDILLLHKNYGKGSSHLIAICQKNCTDKNDELTSLTDIYKAWFLGRELEAQVRENISGLIHGPVKVNSITKSMVKDSLDCDEDYLKINTTYVHIPIKSISEAKEELWKMKQSNILIQEVLQVIRNLYTSGKRSALENNQDKVLRLVFYEKFSVLTIQ